MQDSFSFPKYEKQFLTPDNTSADPQKYFFQLPNDIFNSLCTLVPFQMSTPKQS